MKLPIAIEREIQTIESEYAARGGQQAGSPRLRGLRSAIELYLSAWQRNECAWRREDEEADRYRTDCGHLWEFFNDGPIENHAKFCIYCGQAIKVMESK